MGLAGRKDKQRIGYDPRNLTWSDDKNRFSYKHMTSLGWSDNSGLGSGLSGNPNHIAVVRKLDNGGIGMDRARKDGDDVAANAGQAGRGLEDVLKRLAGASASPSPAPSPAPEEKEKEQEQKVLRNRIASRQKHLNAKRMASQSPAALAEILGVPLSSLPTSPSPGGSASSTPAPESQPEASSSTSRPESADERNADETVKKSTLSVADYFKQKMREKMLARQAAASANGEPSSVKLEDLPSSSLERIADDPKKPVGGTAWEGTKMAFSEPEVAVEFNPSDRPVTPPPEEQEEKAAKKARKEAKKLAKAQAKTGGGVESPAPEHDPIHEAAEVVHHFEHIGDKVETEKEKKKREKEEKKRRKEAQKAEESKSGSGESTKEDKKRKRDEDADEVKPKKDKKDRKDKKDKKAKKSKDA